MNPSSPGLKLSASRCCWMRSAARSAMSRSFWAIRSLNASTVSPVILWRWVRSSAEIMPREGWRLRERPDMMTGTMLSANSCALYVLFVLQGVWTPFGRWPRLTGLGMAGIGLSEGVLLWLAPCHVFWGGSDGIAGGADSACPLGDFTSSFIGEQTWAGGSGCVGRGAAPSIRGGLEPS